MSLRGGEGPAQPDDRRTAALGVYVDTAYRRGPDGVVLVAPENAAFWRFLSAVLAEVGPATIFGRADPSGRASEPIRGSYALAELPGYSSLWSYREVLDALPALVKGLWSALGRVDALLVFGPQPIAIVLALLGAVRGKPVVLGVRQDTVPYLVARGGGTRGVAAAARAIDWAYRSLARRNPTIVVGERLADRYRAKSDRVMAFRVATISKADLAVEPVSRRDDGLDRLVHVGRISPDKAPHVLVEAMERLVEVRGREVTLTWAGSGPLQEEIERLAASRGLGEVIRFVGQVPFGERLFDILRSSDVFVHTARVEGVPQTLVEAQALGVPIVATDVGSVVDVVSQGRTGILVPPGDPDALAQAVAQSLDDPVAAEAMAAAGLRAAGARALEPEAASVARYIRSALGRSDATAGP